MGSKPIDDAPVSGTKRKKYQHIKKEIDDDEEEDLHICGTNRFRKIPPTDYLFRIELFSLLLESGVERFDSMYFNSGGKKWKLSLHPGKKADVGGHISLSLAIEEPSNGTPGWEVNRRFDWMKLEWRFPNLISHNTLKDPSKGYLVNDCCVFGVEGNLLKERPFHGLKNLEMDQSSTKHYEITGKGWFEESKKNYQGWANFMRLDLIKQKESGYVVNDSIIIEAELIHISPLINT
ncbi:hypothetical protein Tsubulata_002127 [Turnera subulata]|uniref:MATH domain-containing protein n=1 Tax=Turnera subulata TaxID=218843 RepID=A0A9Q0FL02_9ROSI|nr:hypothetical protein Tsubulata_002127 [Turnera subulata]